MNKEPNVRDCCDGCRSITIPITCLAGFDHPCHSPKAEWEIEFDEQFQHTTDNPMLYSAVKSHIRQTILKYIDMVNLEKKDAAERDTDRRMGYNQAVDELNSLKEKIKESLIL